MYSTVYVVQRWYRLSDGIEYAGPAIAYETEDQAKSFIKEMTGIASRTNNRLEYDYAKVQVFK